MGEWTGDTQFSVSSPVTPVIYKKKKSNPSPAPFTPAYQTLGFRLLNSHPYFRTPVSLSTPSYMTPHRSVGLYGDTLR